MIRLVIIDIFICIAFLSAAYLSYTFYTKKDVACWFFHKDSCKLVLRSPHSKIFFGIPNAYLGLVGSLGIISLVTFYSYGLIPFWPIQSAIVFGFLFSCYLSYIQAFVVKAFCFWCSVSAVSFLILFLAVFI